MAIKQLDKSELTKDGRKWIFYDYIENLEDSRKNINQKSFSLKLRLYLPKETFY